MFTYDAIRARIPARTAEHVAQPRDVRALSSVAAMLARQVDFLKARVVTALFTSLNAQGQPTQGDEQMTSLVDTWQHRATVRLQAGIHHVRLLHQETAGAHLARLSWRTGDGAHRLIGDPPAGARLVPPTLEDGYLLLLDTPAIEAVAA